MSAKAIGAIDREVVRCTKCPQLRGYCALVAAEKKRAYRDWTYWGKPVPAFGDPDARVVLVGLAPGAHGSNRTGRMFTGDASGDFLYPALHRAGFATQATALSRDDGMELRDCFITAALRCAPPQNKPAPRELQNCFPYLVRELAALERMQVVVGLGAIGTKAAIDALKGSGYAIEPQPWRFGHGIELSARKGKRSITVVASFHPSRQNTNTGKLTAKMFDSIFTRANALLR
ncbi:MAG TPA: uracil-DNA glycosylase [Candidatus Baltobacteraceae bacterium]|nr:uracil-DNA glycosylase [Candidatus Baltobacteraceae bacterium]